MCNRLLFPPSFVCPLAGLPTVRFGFFSALCSLIEAKKYPVGFPMRHQRRFYSVFCKLLSVYLLVTIWVTANVLKSIPSSSQQIRQAVFSFGDICCSAILFYGFHQELWVTEILLHKIIRLHIMHPKICFTKFAWFFSRSLKLIICSSNPFRKYRSSNRLALLQRITRSSNISSLLKIRRSLFC